MMKKMSVKFREDFIFICVDDKVVVLIGEFGKFVLIVWVYYRFFVLQNVIFVVLDYDFYVYGVVFLVLFRVEIFENSFDSFYEGIIYVIIKDKFFQFLLVVRYIIEIISILRFVIFMDGIFLIIFILFLYLDGGLDYWLIYWFV